MFPGASLKTILGDDCPKMDEVGNALRNHFSSICSRDLECFDADSELPAELAVLIHNT